MRVQNHTVVSEYILYHQALIKVLVEEELGKRNKNWDHFLFYRAGQPTPTPLVSQPHPQLQKEEQRERPKNKISIRRPREIKKRFLQSTLREIWKKEIYPQKVNPNL